MGLLAGKVAVVTGGGGGIGRGIVERFAAEGAHVVFAEIDRERATATAAAVAGSAPVVGDVCRPEVVAELFEMAGPRVDVLVNNVGHYGRGRGAFHEQAHAEWDELYRVNLDHVLRCSQAAIRRMLTTGGGAIVNLSTIEAFRGIPTRAVYSAFKAAITGLTKSLAVEYARAGIRVNAIAPDVTETIQVPYSRWLSPGELARVPTWVPVGRFGTPADHAGVALFLASDLAAFVTGTTLHVDGGTFAAGGWFPTEEGGWTNRPRRP